MTIKTAKNQDPSPVRVAVAAALDRKAVDLKVLDLDEVSDFAEFFLLCSGTNDRQVQALADGVTRAMRAAGHRPLHIEGHRNAKWVLLDYGHLVIHVFDETTRSFYALEKLWADAPDVTERFSD